MENFRAKTEPTTVRISQLGVNKGPRVPRESLPAGKAGPYFAGRGKAADMT